MAFHDFRAAAGFVERTDERNHQFDVGEAHFVAHELHRAAFHGEAFGELVGDVARSAAEAEHRVFFVRFIERAADQLAVFVALEVGHAHDDLLGPEGGRDRGDAFGDLALEEVLGRSVAGREAFDGGAKFRGNARIF